VLEGLEDPEAHAAGEEAAAQLAGDDGAGEPVLALPPPEAGAAPGPHSSYHKAFFEFAQPPSYCLLLLDVMA
jgi:hypothetical protein